MNPTPRRWTFTSTPSGTLVEVDGASVVVPYSESFVELLSRERSGLDLIDELLRSEHSPYLESRLARLLAPVPDKASARLLDFGCGAGASAVVLCRLGFRQLTGVDIIPGYEAIWRARLDEAGFRGVGRFQVVRENAPLPWADGTFDVFLLNGVLEHLLPEERVFVLREGARLVRSGGFLAIAETPNRWFPRNSHTKLWFSELLPADVAARAALAFGIRKDFPRFGRTSQFRTGFRGMDVRQVESILRGTGATPYPSDPTLARDEFLMPRNPLQSPRPHSRMGGMAWSLTRTLASMLRRPAADLAPHLNLLFRMA